MAYSVKKLIWWCLQPTNLFTLIFCMGVLLLWTSKQNLGRKFLSGLFVFLAILSVVPITDMVATPLEDYFPQPTLPDQIDGVIVLGGSVQVELTQARGQVALNDGAERMTTLVQLATYYPNATLLFSGGSNSLTGSTHTEADVARIFFEPFGLSDRVLFEEKSRDTYENVLFSKQLVSPREGDTWILITSALHMPRAVGVFEKVGWQVLPYPVDYLRSGSLAFSPTPNALKELVDFSRVASEWLALVAFRVLGRTNSFLPSQMAPL